MNKQQRLLKYAESLKGTLDLVIKYTKRNQLAEAIEFLEDLKTEVEECLANVSPDEQIEMTHSQRTDMVLYRDACDNYHLPSYSNPIFQKFVADCYAEDFDLRHYRGRNFYVGPATVVENVEEVREITKVPLNWDNMGKQFVVYPKV